MLMYTNADCTLYLYSKKGKQEMYTRKPVRGVYWEDVRQSSFLKTGQRDACAATVIIPRESVNEAIPFTQGKDLIIKGIVSNLIDSSSQRALSESLAALKQAYSYLTVVAVDERLYGSESVQHYELSCK